MTSLENTHHVIPQVEVSRVSSKGVQATDITIDFLRATSVLPVGQLIKDESFTLYEAVGALEIMDPKMDSGYLKPGETLEDGYDVLQSLLPEQVVGIIDQLLYHEMAWHMGHPLSQTLFTSIYIDFILWPDPKTLGQAFFDRKGGCTDDNKLLHLVLQAYCLGLIKSCDYVHQAVCLETYYEEEDFVTNLYNRRLLPDFHINDFERLLDRAIEWVRGQEESISSEHRNALLTRLEFRKAFLQAVWMKYTGDVQPRYDELWDRCLSMISDLLKSRVCGVPVNSSFSEKIQRRLASTVPPRPIVNISYQDAYAHLKQLCRHGKAVVRVRQCRGGNDIITFVLTFQSQKPQPSVYIRCVLQSLILDEMKVLGRTSIKQLIFKDLEEISLPVGMLVDPLNDEVEAPQNPRFQIGKRMDLFVGRVGQSYLDISRALSMNRSRMRRMLCHTVMDWDNIQLDAEELDTELRQYTKEEPVIDRTADGEEIWSFPLSSWAYYQKLRQMEWITQMGFELQVYRTSEMAGMYWHLQHIAHNRLRHLHRIRGFTARRRNQTDENTKQQTASFINSFSFLSFAMLETSATQSFADGLSTFYAVLTHLSIIPSQSSPPYSNPHLRYSLRMRPFLPISLPAVVPYEEFAALSQIHYYDPSQPYFANALTIKDSKSESARLLELLDTAASAIKTAKEEWREVGKSSAETARCVGCEMEWRVRVKDVIRSVIFAGIAIASVRKWVEEGAREKSGRVLEMEEGAKGYHDWWIVPKIRSVKL